MVKKGPPKKSRGWCFTVNNYTDDDVDNIFGLYGYTDATYIVVGKEIGEQGTPHLQGFIYYSSPRHFLAMKTVFEEFGISPHLEPQKGSNVSAITYCMEDGDYTELGVIPRQGHRTDLWLIKMKFQSGEWDLNYVRLNYPDIYCRYFRGLKAIRKAAKPYVPPKVVAYDSMNYKHYEYIRVLELKKALHITSTYYDHRAVYIAYNSTRYDYILIPSDALRDDEMWGEIPVYHIENLIHDYNALSFEQKKNYKEIIFESEAQVQDLL